MIEPVTGVRVYLACGVTDMRKGIEGMAAFAQNTKRQKPTSGAVFAIRGRRGDRLKLLLWDGRRLPLLHGDGAGAVTLSEPFAWHEWHYWVPGLFVSKSSIDLIA